MHGVADYPTPLLGPYPCGYRPPKDGGSAMHAGKTIAGRRTPGRRLLLFRPGASWGPGGPPPPRDP
eukprot:15301979-Alexandrium_andersonii.AAC.1